MFSSKIHHIKPMGNPTEISLSPVSQDWGPLFTSDQSLPAHTEHSQSCTGHMLYLCNAKRKDTFQINAVCSPCNPRRRMDMLVLWPSSFLTGWRVKWVSLGMQEKTVPGISSDSQHCSLLFLWKVARRDLAASTLGGFPDPNRQSHE